MDRQSTSLALRYAVALLLIAGLATTAYTILSSTLRTEESRSEVIDVAGKQRMLSQRIALLLVEKNVHISNGIPVQNSDDITNAIKEFESGHTFLIRQPISSESAAIYYEEEQLDRASKLFITTSKKFELQLANHQPVENTVFEPFIEHAKTTLLQKLDAAVQQYEKEGTAAIQALESTELTVYLVTLSLLILEALFIFYPANKHIKTLFQKTQEAKNQAELAARHRQIVLDTVSHELRTPLTSLLFAQEEVARQHPELKENKYIQDIDRAASDIEKTLESVLNFNLIEEQGIATYLSPVDFGKWFNAESEQYRIAAEQKNLSFNYAFTPVDDSEDLLVTDISKLKTILRNLIENAIYFIEDGGISLIAKVLPDETGHKLIISIKDTGPGIAETDLETIFIPFHSSAKTGAAQRGIGLGLSFVKSHIDALGGQIAVSSTVGSGSTFIVSLPVTMKPSGTLSDNDNSKEQDCQLRCLLAEDNPVNQIIAGKLLSLYGFSMEVVGDGTSALELANQRSFDLIMLDILMPNVNGVEVCKKIKQMPHCKNTPVFAFTANATSDDLAKYDEAGFDAVIAKPIDKTLLKTKLQEYGFQLSSNA